jgi:hypothetical protein
MNYVINLGNKLDGKKLVECATLAECQKKLDDTCAANFNELSQRDCHRGFGDVKQNGRLVNRVSWNGRIWNLDGSEYGVEVAA